MVITPDPLILSLSAVSPWLQPKSIRTRIMDEIVKRLSRIAVGSYFTNAGSRVDYGQLIVAEPPEVPMINVWDGDEQAEKSYGNLLHRVDVTVELYDRREDNTDPISRVANLLLADCLKAMVLDEDGQVDLKLGGLSTGIQYVSSTLTLGLEGELWIAAIVSWSVEYTTAYGDPNNFGEQ